LHTGTSALQRNNAGALGLQRRENECHLHSEIKYRSVGCNSRLCSPAVVCNNYISRI